MLKKIGRFILCLLLIFLIKFCLYEKEKKLCIVGKIVSIYVEIWKQHWPFKEESEKWRERWRWHARRPKWRRHWRHWRLATVPKSWIQQGRDRSKGGMPCLPSPCLLCLASYHCWIFSCFLIYGMLNATLTCEKDLDASLNVLLTIRF